MKIINAIKSNDSIEFIVENHGSRLHGTLTKGTYFNWIAFPSMGVSCELADLDDHFWNEESLSRIIPSNLDIETILELIDYLKFMFDDDEYFDGKRFISKSEYIFWLENECESLSRQLIEWEVHTQNDDVDKWLEYNRLQYYKYMREQYDKNTFLD